MTTETVELPRAAIADVRALVHAFVVGYDGDEFVRSLERVLDPLGSVLTVDEVREGDARYAEFAERA